jgi:hypothetical protein
MGSNQSKMDALNSQMNLLVESQAEEIETLKQMRVDDKIYNEEVLSKLMKENKELNYRIDALSKMNSKKHKYHKNKCEEVKKLKQEVSQKKDAWDGNKVLEDLLENTKYGQAFETAETTFIEYIQKLEKEIEKLKERQMIMGAVADEHINDMNGIHKEYGDMVRKLKEEIKQLKKELTDEKEDSLGLRKHFNIMLDLIKTADTPEKIKMLKEMDTRFEY